MLKKYTGTISGAVVGEVTSLTRPTPAKLVIEYRTVEFGTGSATLTSPDGSQTYSGPYTDAHCEGAAVMTIIKEEGDDLILEGSFDGGHWLLDLSVADED